MDQDRENTRKTYGYRTGATYGYDNFPSKVVWLAARYKEREPAAEREGEVIRLERRCLGSSEPTADQKGS